MMALLKKILAPLYWKCEDCNVVCEVVTEIWSPYVNVYHCPKCNKYYDMFGDEIKEG